MATLVTGLFKARSSAERAIEDLVAHGWSRDDISLLMSDATQGREFGLAMASKAPEGAATGGTIGGVLGAIAAGLVAAGGLTGALIGRGIRKQGARFFNEEIEHGGILIGVSTHDDRAGQARKIL